MFRDFLVYAGVYRLVVVAVGFGSILLGYKLFRTLAPSDPRPSARNSAQEKESEFGFEIRDVRVSLRTAAPGTFFALFGAVLISLMVATGAPELKTATVEDLASGVVEEETLLRSGTVDELRAVVNRYDDGYYDSDPAAGLERLISIVRRLQ